MASSKKCPSPIEIINLTSDSDMAHKCIKASYLGSSSNDDDQDSEIVVLSNKTPILPILQSKVSTTTDKVQVVGIHNEQCLPHMRQHCLEHRYNPNSTADNQRYCHKCYCYVCDILASECSQWSSHCNATDIGAAQDYWRSLWNTKQLTKCRHCQWTGRLAGIFLEYATEADWCERCGRVASIDFYAKEQAPQYTLRRGDIFLGTKTIHFRLKVRDPRRMKLFRKEWEDGRWEYDVKEWEEDLFNHRFGRRPTLKMIFYSIPILEESKLPNDWDPDYSCDPNYQHNPDRSHTEYPGSASETETLLIQDRNHRLVLLLLQIMQQDYDRTSAVLNFNIEATWSKETSTGVSH